MRLNIIFFLLLFLCFGCQSTSNEAEQPQIIEGNPPAPGFNAESSDAKAIAIADEVMEAMGGRQNWEETRYIVWNFFGRRKLYWDKQTGDVRIESQPDSTIYLVNIHQEKGKVKRGDKIMENPDSVATYVERGKSIWINDSYWLVMPYKLKDSGVTLKYVGEDTTQVGALADVLELTFEEVGDTPDNKYLVYVDKDSRLVTQWDFFTNYQDEEPRFSTPWDNYQTYGGIKLSGGRGRSQLSDIGVYTHIPEAVFTGFGAVNSQNFQR